MTTTTVTSWEIAPHTVAKHEILRLYLGAWFPILGKRNKRLVYVDGFCGPGRYQHGEPGSPIVALGEALKHQDRLGSNHLKFLFVDEDQDRVAHLREVLDELPCPPNFEVRPVAGQFSEQLTRLLDELEQSGTRVPPVFAFIDPFGFKGVPFGLVRRLLTNPKAEVFVNVMADAINRFVEHPVQQTREHIVDLFGTDCVLDIAKKPVNRIGEERRLYQKQLRGCARYVRYFEMRNARDRRIYYLFFATNHPLGHVKMKEAFWKVDPLGGLRFSDATNPNQPVLFEIDVAPSLADELVAVFGHKRVQVEAIADYIDKETPFIATHKGQALRLLEKDGRIAVAELKANRQRRRTNTYPNEAIVTFR